MYQGLTTSLTGDVTVLIGDVIPNGSHDVISKGLCDVISKGPCDVISGGGLNLTLMRDMRCPIDAKLMNFGVGLLIGVDVFIGAEVILLVLILIRLAFSGLDLRDLYENVFCR